MSSLYKRITKMKDTIEEAKELEKFYQTAPKPSDSELADREKRALERLLETVEEDLENFVEPIALSKDKYLDEFDMSDMPPSISASDFKGIQLLTAVTKSEEESFIIALLPDGKFVKFKFFFDTKTKSFEKFSYEEWEVDKVLALVPCEEIFNAVEKAVKSYNKATKDRKPSHIKRQEFLVKIGG